MRATRSTETDRLVATLYLCLKLLTLDEAPLLTHSREMALQVRGELPKIKTLLPWERELLLPIMEQVAELLLNDQPEDQEDEYAKDSTEEE